MRGKNSERKEGEGERWQKKALALADEVRLLKAQAKKAEAGLAQWGRVVDSTLIQVALSHGAQVGEGAWEIVIPLVRVFENGRDYAVTTTVSPDRKNYTVRVEKRGNAMPYKDT